MQTLMVQTCRHLRCTHADIYVANVQTFNEVQNKQIFMVHTYRSLWCTRTTMHKYLSTSKPSRYI